MFEDHQEDNYMVTQIYLPGEFLFNIFASTWVEPIDDESTKVTIVILGTARYGTRGMEARFHKDFQKALNIISDGKPLPLMRPEN